MDNQLLRFFMEDDKVRTEIKKKEEELILLKAAEILNTKGKVVQDYFNSFLQKYTLVGEKSLPVLDCVGSNGFFQVDGFVRVGKKKNTTTT